MKLVIICAVLIAAALCWTHDISENIKIERLDELLTAHLEPNEIITDYSTKPLTAPGDNYGSTMIALDVKITNKKSGQERIIQLVNKMIPQDPFYFKMTNTKITYIKEIEFYLKAVPALLKLQEDFSVPEEDLITQIIPECFGARIGFGTEVDGDAAILLENLKPLGFSMKDKKVGLDFNHAKLVMAKLAYIHALPIALKRKRPDIFEKSVAQAAKYFTRIEDCKDKEEIDAKFKELGKRVFRKLPIKSDVVDRAIKTIETNCLSDLPETKEPFVTIMHEDVWVNNIMFVPDNRNANLPGRIAFVDFATTLLNSPMCDVLFFLYTSVTPIVRKNNFYKLMDIYVENFHKCLRQVDSDTSDFSKRAMLAELNRVAGSRLYEIFLRLRPILADAEVLKDPDWCFRVDFGGQEYMDRIADIVVDFDKRGWLNEDILKKEKTNYSCGRQIRRIPLALCLPRK